jgi:hypothetical protein
MEGLIGSLLTWDFNWQRLIVLPALLYASWFVVRYVVHNLDYARIGQSLRNVISQYLSRRNRIDSEASTVVRHSFSEAPLGEAPHLGGHPHPFAAGARMVAGNLMTTTATLSGREVFHLQMSRRDQLQGCRGNRSYYWAKDLNCDASDMKPCPSDMVLITDVDYYLDMPRLLAQQPSNYLIFTMAPEAVAMDAGDFKFTFDEDSNIRVSTNGGTPYGHKLWNYNMDFISVCDTILGVPYKRVVYAVEQRRTSEHRAVVLLAPVAVYTGLASWLASFLYAATLQRLNVITTVPATTKRPARSFLRLRVNAERLMVSTGIPHHYICATIPTTLDDALALVAARSIHGITDAAVNSIVGFDIEDAKVRSSLLATFHEYAHMDEPDIVSVVRRDVHVYHHAPTNHTPADEDSAMVPFMAPIYDAAYAPATTINSEKQAVDSRVTAFHNRDIPEMSHADTENIRRFAELVVPRAHVGLPVSHDEVANRLKRPTQRVLVEQGRDLGPFGSHTVKSFVKAEAYGKPGDPRIISTIRADTKTDYSCYTYALADAICTLDFIMMNKSPAEIAARVAELCGRAKSHVTVTDHSRFDGHVNAKTRLLERAIMLRYFHVSCHAEMERLMNLQYGQGGRTRQGHAYKTECDRASGSPETSIFNTLLNSFIAFCELVEVCESADEAFKRLGAYLGDDGLSVDARPQRSQDIASAWGLELTCDVVKRGKVGVEFLSRIYSPEVWAGNMNSMADPRRLSKFHCGVRRQGATDHARFVERLSGYACTDRNTPAIGDLITRAIELGVTLHHSNELGLRPYYAEEEASKRYPNVSEPWMLDAYKTLLPDFPLDAYVRVVRLCADITQLRGLRVTRFEPTKVTVPTVIDGELHIGSTAKVVAEDKQPPATKPAVTKPAKKPKVVSPRTKVARDLGAVVAKLNRDKRAK